jgi:hypothetical protein
MLASNGTDLAKIVPPAQRHAAQKRLIWAAIELKTPALAAKS